jgi:uncharacterized membrane protein
MATLTVWRFDDASGADQAVSLFVSLSKQELIRVHDAATVSWEPGAKKPKTRQQNNLTGAGALGGMFWGMLFGLIFFVPLLGAAIGAASGALAGSLSDVGIDDDFIKRVRDRVTPGTSALFLLSSDAVFDKVKAAVEETGLRPELLESNLSTEQEQELRAMLGS